MVAQRERLNFRPHGAAWPSFHLKHFGLGRLLSLTPAQRSTFHSIRPIKFCDRKTEIELIIGCAAIHISFIVLLDFAINNKEEKERKTQEPKQPNHFISILVNWFWLLECGVWLWTIAAVDVLLSSLALLPYHVSIVRYYHSFQYPNYVECLFIVITFYENDKNHLNQAT